MAIKIAAAASLVNGLGDVIAAFKEIPAYEDYDVTVPWYGSSGNLARRILGLPGYDPIDPDVFISASEGAMDVVENGGKMAAGTRFDFIANRLVIIRNSNASSVEVSQFSDVSPNNATLANAHIWIANPYEPDFVPAGIYSESAFKAVEHWGYVYGKALLANPSTIAPDVQLTLAGVSGDGSPAIGVVYNSDAVNEPAVTIIADAGPAINNTIIYPAAQISQTSQDDDEISNFLAFLDNPDNVARDIFIAKGFRSLTPLAR
jgi:molybdate transport system substrate-binding protein